MIGGQAVLLLKRILIYISIPNVFLETVVVDMNVIQSYAKDFGT